jgi:hypothetical protein
LIPSNQTPGNDFTIRVTSTSNGTYTDTSNGNFTIVVPTITVVSSNGGETWPAGSPQTITWTYTGNPGANVRIQLLKGGVVNRTIAFSPIGAGGIGSYNWSIASTQTAGADYRIRITSTTNATVTDTSNGNFTINVLPALLIVTRPNGGEALKAGTLQDIRWNYTNNPGPNMKIELLKGGVLVSVIASSIPIVSGGQGIYHWTVQSAQIPGADYKVRLTSLTNAAITDTSNTNFAITAP